MHEVQYFILVVVVLAYGHFSESDEQMLSQLFVRLEAAANARQRIE